MPDYDVITYTRPDGQVIDLSNAPYITNDYDGFGIGEFQHTLVAPPGVHGDWWYDTRMEAKILTVDFSYYGDGTVERQASRRRIVEMFNPLLGPGVLRIVQESGVDREIDCILAESLMLPSDDFMGVGAYRAVARFRSHGVPAFRDHNMKSQAIGAYSNAGFMFPWQFPRQFAQSGYAATINITNVGDIDTPVKIAMNGPMVDPIFYHANQAKRIQLSPLTIGLGDTIYIDTNPASYAVQVNGVDAWNLLQSGADFWQLTPGINTIIMDMGGTTVQTTGTISWYDRYLGL